MHTIFSLLRIFKVDEADPLVWQLSFIDHEIQKILEGRDRAITRHMNPYEVRALGGVRAAAQRALHLDSDDIINQEDGGRLGDTFGQADDMLSGRRQAKKPKVSHESSGAEQRPLDPDENCCVCYDVMNEDQNLAFCKFSCGRNLHTECMERWVKHKVASGQGITCPLCRESWGSNALEDLKATTT